MIIKCNNSPSPLFWEENFIKDFELANERKVISTLAWSPEPALILTQIKFFIEENVEIILSELLPHELPSMILEEEFEFFLERYLYFPPQIPNNKDNLSNINDSSKIIFIDSIEPLPSLDIYNRCLSDQGKSLIVVDNACSHENIERITENIINSNSIYLSLRQVNPQLLSYIVSLTLKLSKSLTLDDADIISTARLKLLGLELKNNAIFNSFSGKYIYSQNESLRERIRIYLNKDENHLKIVDETILQCLSNQNYFKIFKDLNSSKEYKYYTKIIYSVNVDQNIWKNPIIYNIKSDRIFKSRYEIKYLFSIYSHNNHLDACTRIEIRNFFISLLETPHNHTFTQTIVSIISEYPSTVSILHEAIVKFYTYFPRVKEIMSTIAKIFLEFIESIKVNSTNETFIGYIKEFLHYDLSNNRLEKDSQFKFYPKLLEANSSSVYSDILAQNLSKGIYKKKLCSLNSFQSYFFNPDEITKNCDKFEFNQQQQDSLILNILNSKNLYFNDISWENQDSFLKNEYDLKSFFSILYHKHNFKSAYLLRILSRYELSFKSYFNDMENYSNYDTQLLTFYSITNKNHNIKLPEEDFKISNFSYNDVLKIILLLSNNHFPETLINHFKNNFNSLSSIKTLIPSYNLVSEVHFLLHYTNSPYTKDIRRLDECLNPRGLRPFNFYLQNIK
jgi:hypothetical protein